MQHKAFVVILCLSVIMLAHVTEGHFRLGRREMEVAKAREDAPEFPRRVNREEKILERLEEILRNHEDRARDN